MVELTHSLADQLAEALGETDPIPKLQLNLIVEHLGAEFAEALLAEVQQIEVNGGMITANGKRRRTPGGVYFYLARQRATADQRRLIFNASKKAGSRGTWSGATAPASTASTSNAAGIQLGRTSSAAE